MKRYLPFILFLLGFMIIAVSAFLILHKTMPVPSGDVPSSLAGYALADQTSGEDAVAEIQNLHLGDFQVQDAYVASYGTQNVVLWTADAGSDDGAQALLTAMDNAIMNAADGQLSMMGVFVFSNRQVRSLDGLGQLHFYFQSGRKVVWVSADYGMAEQAVQEALQFYP